MKSIEHHGKMTLLLHPLCAFLLLYRHDLCGRGDFGTFQQDALAILSTSNCQFHMECSPTLQNGPLSPSSTSIIQSQDGPHVPLHVWVSTPSASMAQTIQSLGSQSDRNTEHDSHKSFLDVLWAIGRKGLMYSVADSSMVQLCLWIVPSILCCTVFLWLEYRYNDYKIIVPVGPVGVVFGGASTKENCDNWVKDQSTFLVVLSLP